MQYLLSLYTYEVIRGKIYKILLADNVLS